MELDASNELNISNKEDADLAETVPHCIIASWLLCAYKQLLNT